MKPSEMKAAILENLAKTNNPKARKAYAAMLAVLEAERAKPSEKELDAVEEAECAAAAAAYRAKARAHAAKMKAAAEALGNLGLVEWK